MFLWVHQQTLVQIMHKYIKMFENDNIIFLPPIVITIPIEIIQKGGFPTKREILESFLDMGIIPFGISTDRRGKHYLENKKEVEKNKQVYLFTLFGVQYKKLPEC